MNKNTITGLLLMGLVILLFMFINKPSQEELDRQAKEKQEMEAKANQTNNPEVMTLDTVAPAERTAIAATIRKIGTLNAADSTYTLPGRNAVLTLSADSVIGGEVTVGNAKVPVADIVNARYDGIDEPVASEALKTLRAVVKDAMKYQGLSHFLNGKEDTITIHNDVLELRLSTKGAMITTARMLDPRYTRYSGGQVEPIAPGADSYGFVLSTGETEYDTRDFYYTAQVSPDSLSVTMTITPGDGVMLGFSYSLDKEGYLVKMDMIQDNMSALVPSASSMKFKWNQRMARNEAGRVFEAQNSAIYYMTGDGDVDNLSETSDDKESLDNLVWVAYKNQFFSTVFIPTTEAFTKAELISTDLKEENSLKVMDTEALMKYNPEHATPASFTMFIGPNSYHMLSDISETIIPEKDLELQRLVPLGWSLFRWINTLIVIPVFDFLGKFISNYGIIILLLTIFIKLILFPFTYKSYMSQAKMRVLAPEIKEINEKYPGKENAMRRQQETMALYSRAGASPLSGCLPMLLQLPILIAMFKFFPSAIELRGESFLWASDLSAPDAIIPLPFSIPFLGDRLSLFCLLMTAVNIIYTRINMQNQPGNASMPAMKWMMYLMPVMFLFFFNNYAAGLSYYYLLSLLITIIQTYIFRRIVNEEKVRATMKANAAKPKKKSGFMARLEEAQRRQQAMLREQEKQRAKRGGRK